MAAGAPRPNYNPFDVALTLSNVPPPAAPPSAQYTPGGYVPPPFALQEQSNPSAYQPGGYDAKPTGAPAGPCLVMFDSRDCSSRKRSPFLAAIQ